MKTHREIVEREVCWNMTGGRCFYCGRNLLPDSDTSELMPDADFRAAAEFQKNRKPGWVVDHKVSRSRRGVDSADNYAPACDDCNGQKGPKTPAEYRAFLIRNGVPAVFFGGARRDWLMVASVPRSLKPSISDARRRFQQNLY